MAEEQKSRPEINGIRTFCHALPDENGNVDPHQPYMGVIRLTVFKGKRLAKVNILANFITELRMNQPGVEYPVGILNLPGGSLKEFQSGKRLLTPFTNRGNGDIKYLGRLGVGFGEFVNEKVIEGLAAQIPEASSDGKRPFKSVTFTVDCEGKVYHLNYSRLANLTEAADELINEPSENEGIEADSMIGSEDKMQEAQGE